MLHEIQPTVQRETIFTETIKTFIQLKTKI